MSTSVSSRSFDPHAATRFGPYEVVRYLAEGGMAWVYEARDPRFPARRLALKVLKPQAGQGELFHRFVTEAKLLAGVDHPNLVTIFDLARDEGTGLAYYTMTYVEGATFVRKHPVPSVDAIPPFLGILEGLAELHDRGVIHRDIKPGNMLLKQDGRALLADLGIARDPDSKGLTQAGTVMGTPAYMPPEQAAGQPVDARADLFAIGMSIYRVVTGATVYERTEGVDARSGQSILVHLAGRTATGSELDFPFPDDVPEALRTVVRKACRFDRDARYATARELRDDLAAALASKPPAPRVDPGAPAVVPAPKQRLDPNACERLAGYEIVRFVAEGGMGWVFEARAPGAPDDPLALKALKPGIGSDEELHRFRSEAELLATIDHPNLMGVRDSGVDEATGTSYYTMPFIDSPPLSARGRLEPSEALRIVDGVLTALAELHRRGIVHRDVKPANILLREDATPVLMDLGIARQTNQQTMTSTGMFLGTALYASPEQARGARVGPPSDVFAVGLLLHRLVTGRSVYADVSGIDLGNDTSVLFHLAKLEHAGSELEIAPSREVPPAVQDLVRRACRFRPEDRFADALAMRSALRQARRDPGRRAAGERRWPIRVATAAALTASAVIATTVDWRAVLEGMGSEPASLPTRITADPASAVAPAPALAVERRAVPDEPPPLSILARSPSTSTAEVAPSGETALSVEVDPGVGNVIYAWTVDGVAADEVGSTYVYRGERSADVAVAITDRRGVQVDTAWRLEASNKDPRLGLVPSVSRVSLSVGDRRRFAARASDPDGDPVSVDYLIDGRVVGHGASFVFVADQPGDIRLVARADDGRGGVTEVERFVRVRGTLLDGDPFRFDEAPAAIDPGANESVAREEGTGGGNASLPPSPNGPGAGPGGAGPAAVPDRNNPRPNPRARPRARARGRR